MVADHIEYDHVEKQQTMEHWVHLNSRGVSKKIKKAKQRKVASRRTYSKTSFLFLTLSGFSHPTGRQGAKQLHGQADEEQTDSQELQQNLAARINFGYSSSFGGPLELFPVTLTV